MTASGAYASVGESTGLKGKQVKECLEAYMALAASQLKTSGSFKLGGTINMKLKSKPARPAKKGVNPFTTVATSRPPAFTPGAAGLSERRRSLCLLGLLFWVRFIVCALALPLYVPVAFGLSGCDELIVIVFTVELRAAVMRTLWSQLAGA
jgi:nucleoid DNA-binding protein